MFAQKQSFPSCLRRLSLICLVVVGFTHFLPAQDASTRNAQLTELLDRVWDFELVEAPLLATDVGEVGVCVTCLSCGGGLDERTLFDRPGDGSTRSSSGTTR